MKMALNGNDFDRNDQINLKYVCMFDIYFECKKYLKESQSSALKAQISLDLS